VLYSIDTSALIYAWNLAYPQIRFPSLWREMDSLINNGILLATDEVKNELSIQQDELYKWIQQREAMFVQLELDIQMELEQILNKFPNAGHSESLSPNADPLVVAVARVRKCAVVTQEKGGSNTNPKIPYMCSYYKIRCIDLFDFVKEQNWSF